MVKTHRTKKTRPIENEERKRNYFWCVGLLIHIQVTFHFNYSMMEWDFGRMWVIARSTYWPLYVGLVSVHHHKVALLGYPILMTLQRDPDGGQSVIF